MAPILSWIGCRISLLRYLSHEQQLEVFTLINRTQRPSLRRDFEQLPPELRARVFEFYICGFLIHNRIGTSSDAKTQSEDLSSLIDHRTRAMLYMTEGMVLFMMTFNLGLITWTLLYHSPGHIMQYPFYIVMALAMVMILLKKHTVRWFWIIIRRFAQHLWNVLWRCVRPPEIPCFTVWHEALAIGVLVRDLAIMLPLLALCEVARWREATGQPRAVAFHQLPIFKLNDQLAEEAWKAGRCLRSRTLKQPHDPQLYDSRWPNILRNALKRVKDARARKWRKKQTGRPNMDTSKPGPGSMAKLPVILVAFNPFQTDG